MVWPKQRVYRSTEAVFIMNLRSSEFVRGAAGPTSFLPNAPTASDSNPPSRREPLSSDVVLRRISNHAGERFMFFDGRAGITYDAAGSPTGLDGDFFVT